jgi:hypothetical protein
MSEESLQSGIEALRAGDKRRARRIFGQIVAVQPDNPDAWLYLAAALDDPEQRLRCLKEVVRLRPDHAQARAALQALERRTGQFIPLDGVRPPVVDGQIVGDSSSGRRLRQPTADIAVLIATTTVAMLAIIAAILLSQVGNAPGFINVDEPQVGPTLYQLTLGVQACTTTEGGAPTLTFINNTVFAVEVLRGPVGEETPLLSLAPGELGAVTVEPGVETRFAVRSAAPGTTGSGARITVPKGSACRVPIQ